MVCSGQAAHAIGRKTMPLGTSPVLTKLHNATSSFLARATIMVLRCRQGRPPCAPDTASAGLGDAVDPAAFFLGRDNGKPELLLQGALLGDEKVALPCHWRGAL